MSVSLWAYDPDKCDGNACPGDCDNCGKSEEDVGEWVHEYDEDWLGGGRTYCTKCGQGYADGAFHEVEEFNFCPNCGARMEARK